MLKSLSKAVISQKLINSLGKTYNFSKTHKTNDFIKNDKFS